MKLIAVFLTVALLQVSAHGVSQNVTLTAKNVTLDKVFSAIRKQTGYVVFYNKEFLAPSKEVSVDLKDVALRDALDEILKGMSLGYSIQGKTIFISPKPKETIVDKVADFFKPAPPSIDVHGKVVDDKGVPVAGASVMVKGVSRGTVTDANGEFSLKGIDNQATLVISAVNIVSKEIKVGGKTDFFVKVESKVSQLDEVSIASNGYQSLPRERSTGAYEVITAKQLQHSNDPNLLRRLEGITTSLVFNNAAVPTNSAQRKTGLGAAQYSPLANLTIRGKNTLAFSNFGSNSSLDLNLTGVPLVVIDGVASPYSIDLVDPETVETITILKDAAASSIWGSRAANGVLVITTKKGRYNTPLSIGFGSTIDITEKLDLFYRPKMSVSDYIDAQIFAFNASGTTIASPTVSFEQPVYSQVAEIMNAWKSNPTPANLALRDAQLNALRGNDVRNDFSKYVLRNAVNQNYNLNLSAGSKNVSHRFFIGYNRVTDNTINSGSNRLNLSYTASARISKDLELSGSILYSNQNSNSQALNNTVTPEMGGIYPYTRLADDAGNPLEIAKTYRPSFISLLESTYGDHLLNWRYKPLEDINEGYTKLKTENININIGANYKILSWLSANVSYGFSSSSGDEKTLHTQNSFYMRNLINLYTSPPGATDPLNPATPITDFTRQLPLGGLYSPAIRQTTNQNLQAGLNIQKTWNTKHELSILARIDINKNQISQRYDQYLGYNDEFITTNTRLDYTRQFPWLFASRFGVNSGLLPGVQLGLLTDYQNRTVGTLLNTGYTYDKRYTLNFSVRKDGNSDLGFGTNKTGTPFYSAGVGWAINNERFYHINWLSSLRLRATYGYNGNVNTQVVPKQLITVGGAGANGLLAINVSNNTSISNRNFRPEKTGTFNLGLNFAIKGGRIDGTVDYFEKNTTDAIFTNIIDPTLGFNDARFNTADLKGKGIEVTLNTINVKSRSFTWSSNFLFTYNRVKVTKLYVPGAKSAGDVVTQVSGPLSFLEGNDINRLYAFKWGGLDPITGDPRGYLNGQLVSISNNTAGTLNFQAILAQPRSEAVYKGSSTPVYYGSFRNSFTYKQFTLSANIMYKLGYYATRFGDQVNYGNLFLDVWQPGEYNRRWQKPGDELKTNVPSLVYNSISARDNFYLFSEINTFKADHIRLQEINFAWSIKTKPGFIIKNPRISANVNNLGVIWRANQFGLDPDSKDFPNPRTYSLGFNANF